VDWAELVEHFALQFNTAKASACQATEPTWDAVRNTLKGGSSASLPGSGNFYVHERFARAGRNPSTCVARKIRKAKVPKLRPGKALKDALN